MRSKFQVPVNALPALVFLALGLLLIGLWSFLKFDERQDIRRDTAITAEQAAVRLQEHILTRVNIARHLRDEIVDGELISATKFVEEAERLHKMLPGALATNFVDAGGIIRWVAPVASNKAAIGVNVRHHPVGGPVLAAAEQSGEPSMTPPIELVQGGGGVVVMYPMSPDGTTRGAVSAVFRLSDLVSSGLGEGVKKKYDVAVRDAGAPVFRHGGGEPKRSLSARRSFAVVDRTWTIELTPGPMSAVAKTSGLEILSLLVGLALSAGLALLFRLYLIRQVEVAAIAAKLHAVIDASPDPIFLKDRQGRYEIANQATADALGRPLEEVLGRTVEDLLPAAEGELPKAAERSVIDNGETVSAETVSGISGEERSYAMLWAPLRDEGDAVTGLVGLAHDISQRKRNEESLRRSEERYRSLIDGSIAGILIHRNDRPLYANQAWANIHGRTVAEVLAAPRVRDFVAEVDRQRLSRMASDRLAGKPVPTHYVYRGRHRDGSEIWLENRVQVVNWEGEPAIQSMVVDVSERRQAEVALRESEERYRALVDMAPDAIIIVAEERIVFANPAAAKLYGTESVEDLIGRQLADFIHPDDHAVALQRRDDILLRHVTAPVAQLKGLRDDGSGFITEATGSYLRWQGRDAVQSIARDVSQRKRLEAELAQSQKMDAIGRLTGGVAHDFNNLLTVINTNLEFLVEDLDPRSEHGEMARLALDAAEHGANVTHQLLAFSRQQPLLPAVVDVASLVAGSESLLGPALGGAIDLEVRLQEDGWRCRVDPSQLQNALLNLALNARDAMPEGGRVTIEVANTVVSGSPPVSGGGSHHVINPGPGEYVMVALGDNGIGIPPESLDRVIDPFFTTKGMANNSGLGLSMVHGFAQQSGGYLDIESAAGGTTVRIYLPKADAGADDEALAADDSATAESDLPGGNESILLVEDDEMVRQSVAGQLRRLGYSVQLAENGRRALQMLEGSAVALMISDIVMPGGMDGRELAAAAQANQPALKMIYISGHVEAAESTAGVDGNETPLLTKPFDNTTLAHAIRAILDGG